MANSAYPAGAFLKDQMVPAKLEKEQRTKRRLKCDEDENALVKARSQGRCEVVWYGRVERKARRCKRAASHIHHMIGGHGKRGRGESIFALRKQHVCIECHGLITGHVLKRIGDVLPRWHDEYEHVGK